MLVDTFSTLVPLKGKGNTSAIDVVGFFDLHDGDADRDLRSVICHEEALSLLGASTILAKADLVELEPTLLAFGDTNLDTIPDSANVKPYKKYSVSIEKKHCINKIARFQH